MFRKSFKKSLAVGAAIHECGGARMGSDPAKLILNSYNQCWDVKNVFVTDGSSFPSSGTVGPALTIMALTTRSLRLHCAGIQDRFTLTPHEAGLLTGQKRWLISDNLASDGMFD